MRIHFKRRDPNIKIYNNELTDCYFLFLKPIYYGWVLICKKLTTIPKQSLFQALHLLLTGRSIPVFKSGREAYGKHHWAN